MLYFAHDGSLNGDWVPDYAARLAANGQEKTLELIRVRDGQVAEPDLEAKLARIRAECQRLASSVARDNCRGNSRKFLSRHTVCDLSQCLECGRRCGGLKRRFDRRSRAPRTDQERERKMTPSIRLAVDLV